MPFFSEIENEHGRILVWKLSEKWEDLLPQITLTATDQLRFDTLRFDKRKTEFLATRILINKELGPHTIIHYSPKGKPLLQNNKQHISISHSANFACIFIAEKKIGVDIEVVNRDINRITKRYLHSDEIKHITGLSDPQLGKIAYWSAKEAIFKCSDAHGIRFNEQIRVRPFDPAEEIAFSAQLILPGHVAEYHLKTQLIENNVMVFCVEQ